MIFDDLGSMQEDTRWYIMILMIYYDFFRDDLLWFSLEEQVVVTARTGIGFSKGTRAVGSCTKWNLTRSDFFYSHFPTSFAYPLLVRIEELAIVGCLLEAGWQVFEWRRFGGRVRLQGVAAVTCVFGVTDCAQRLDFCFSWGVSAGIWYGHWMIWAQVSIIFCRSRVSSRRQNHEVHGIWSIQLCSRPLAEYRGY